MSYMVTRASGPENPCNLCNSSNLCNSCTAVTVIKAIWLGPPVRAPCGERCSSSASRVSVVVLGCSYDGAGAGQCCPPRSPDQQGPWRSATNRPVFFGPAWLAGLAVHGGIPLAEMAWEDSAHPRAKRSLAETAGPG